MGRKSDESIPISWGIVDHFNNYIVSTQSNYVLLLFGTKVQNHKKEAVLPKYDPPWLG